MKKLMAVLIPLIIAVVGVHLLVASHASSLPLFGESSTAAGTVAAPASILVDSSAIGGKEVQFADPPVATMINHNPSGPPVPVSGWHVALADDFNAPLGTASGQDNLWYPSQSWNTNLSNSVQGNNPYETQVYNTSHVAVTDGVLDLSASYQHDVAPATGDGSGSSSANLVQRNYVAGIVTSPTNQQAKGYTGFTWVPQGGATWAFEIVAQWPQNTGELFNAWWSSTQTGWTNERDFFEGKSVADSIDSDWIYHTSPNKLQNYYNTILGFDPGAAMHRYTYVVNADQSWSLYIDGKLQNWVGVAGLAPAQSSGNDAMELIINYALNKTTFTTGTRHFLIDSVAVYQDGAHAGQFVSGGGIAPGTIVSGQ